MGVGRASVILAVGKCDLKVWMDSIRVLQARQYAGRIRWCVGHFHLIHKETSLGTNVTKVTRTTAFLPSSANLIDGWSGD